MRSLVLINPASKFRLRTILASTFVLQLIGIVSLVGYISFVNGQNAVKDVVLQLETEMSSRIEEHLLDFLKSPYLVIQTNAQTIPHFLGNEPGLETLQHYFWEQVQIQDSITSIYFGNPDGGIVGSGREGAEGSNYVYSTEDFKAGNFNKYSVDDFGNPIELQVRVPEFDARSRAWYQNAVSSGTATWNAPYILFTGQDMAVAASHPVYDDEHQLMGVVSVDIFLSHIDNFLQKLEISESGQSYIIEQTTGLLIAQSNGGKSLSAPTTDNEVVQRISANKSNSPLTQHSAEFLQEHFEDYRNILAQEHFELEITGEKYFLLVSPIEDEHGIDWISVIIIPEADFMGQIIANNRNTAVIIVISLLFSSLISIFIAQKISVPISRLNQTTQALADGNWGQRIESATRIKEINDLTTSFNSMAKKLEQTLASLTSEIHERVQAQKAFEESEIRYSSLVENVPVGIFRSTGKSPGKFIATNENFLRMFGLTSIDNFDASDLYAYPEERKNYLEILIKQGSLFSEEIQFRKADGTIFWGVANVRAIIKNNEIEYLDGVIQDISVKKEMEQELQQLNEELELRVEARTLELQHANYELESFAYSVSHDLRAPLRAINGYAQILKSDHAGVLSEEGLDFLSRIEQNSEKMDLLIKSLLNLSQLGYTSLKLETIDLNQIVQSVLELVNYKLENIHIVVAEMPEGRGDRVMVQQVFFNLIENAIKFSQSKDHSTIEIGYELKDKRTIYFVKDNGIGFDQVYADKIFETFQRLHNDDTYEGLGIGLTTVKRIIQRHGGGIWTESEPGKGTVFYFTLGSE